MLLPSRLFALRPIAAALASVSAMVLATSQPAIAQTASPAPDTQQMLEAARRAPKNDLLQIYREAVANDAAYAAARYQQQASQERVPQARSALLPNLGLSASATQYRPDGSNEAFQTDAAGNVIGTRTVDINNPYNGYGGGVSLTIPVYRPQNWQALEQAKISVMSADLQLQQSTQDLALRVATAYFNVLAARDQLIALEAAKKATLEQLQQAKREFEVGTKTIIDTNEAQARYDQIVAQEQVALGTLLVRRSELQTIIGRDLGTLAPLRDKPNLVTPQPADIQQWVRSAEDTSYTVQIARANYEIASREVKRQRDAYKPTLDVVGGYSVNRATGNTINGLDSNLNQGTIGVQLNMPIYQGGLIQSRVREALALQDRYNAELESARRTSANAARDAFTGVNYGLAQVKALESAEVSARTQLDSTQLGYQVGVRILLDVLNATTQLVQTQRDLKRARYDFLLAALRLKAATGALTDEDIAGINALLDPAVSLSVPDVTTPERTSSMVPPARPVARTEPKAENATPAAQEPAAKSTKTSTPAKSSSTRRTKRT
ncbi:MAG TPA: TolC family outer membrane protein [Burkholderiaceae bacterium]|nr:TolC family outer membrane protein [Burkholderiaceae bacterium]